MSSVSSAMRRREACGTNSSVRMLCRRSASLTKQHANVVGDGEQELAQVLGLLGLARNQLQPLQLGEPLHQLADLVAEDMVDLGARRLGILDGVVQQRGHDGGVIELQPGQDRRDFERMRKIRIAGRARLRAMRLHGVDIRAVQQVFVGVGVVRPDAIDEIVLPHHARAGRLRLVRDRRRRRHRDLLGRGLHLPGAAAPERHRITAFFRGTGLVRFWTFNALSNEAAPVVSPETFTFATVWAHPTPNPWPACGENRFRRFRLPPKDAR